MGKEILLWDRQIKHNDVMLRCKERIVRTHLRANRFEEVSSTLENLTQTECKRVVTGVMGGKSLLYHAVMSRNRSLVSFFVECGANVNELVMKDKYSPLLMTAVKLGDMYMIRLLDKLGVDLKKKDKKDANSIVHAIKNMELTMARYLQFRKVDINCGASVILCSKDMDYLEQALEFGFDVNFTGFCRNTAFILATLWKNVDIMTVLGAYGSDIYHRNSRGRNALNEGITLNNTFDDVQEYFLAVYTKYNYVECLEYMGADMMIFDDNFSLGYSYWVRAFGMRRQMNYPRKNNCCFAKNIGVEILTLSELKAIKCDSFKLLLQALLVFVRILPVGHSHLHNAMVTVASNDMLVDDYETTLGILTELVMFHDPDVNMCNAAGYKAIKSGLVIMERTVFLDASTITEAIYKHRFKLFIFFVRNCVWSVLYTCDKMNLTYYSCYKNYLILFLDLLKVWENEGFSSSDKGSIPIMLKILLSENIPFYPITLLHVAVEKKYPLSIMKEILACGANVKDKDIDGNTALDFACAYDDTVKDRQKIIKLLVNAGGDMKTVKAPFYRSRIVKKRPSKKGNIVITLERVQRIEEKAIDLLSRIK